MEGISLSELLGILDLDVVVTLGDITLLEGGAFGALGNHQYQEEMVLEVMTLDHITVCHKQVETFNIQQQLQEDRVRLDLDLAPPQG